MVEAEEKCALIEDFEEETFVRFIEFIYTADYAVPDPLIDLPLLEEEVPPAPPADEEVPAEEEPAAEEATPVVKTQGFKWGSNFEDFLPTKKTKKNRRKKNQAIKTNEWREDVEVILPENARSYGGFENNKERMWSDFQTKAVPQSRAIWKPSQNASPTEDYTEVFLCHAQLYVLSDRYSIGPLRELSLQKLRLNLSEYTLFEERISDIVELVKYTYDHTMDHDHGIDKLRSLVLDYVVCYVKTLVKHSAFTEMVQKRGVLGKDLMLKMVRRLD